MQPEGFVWRQHIEPERARTMPDQWAGSDSDGCATDLTIGDGQYHDVEVRSVEAAAERTLEPGKSCDERTAQSPLTDHRATAEGSLSADHASLPRATCTTDRRRNIAAVGGGKDWTVDTRLLRENRAHRRTSNRSGPENPKLGVLA